MQGEVRLCQYQGKQSSKIKGEEEGGGRRYRLCALTRALTLTPCAGVARLCTVEGREGGMVVVDGLSAHQTLTMGANGRRIAHRVPWGARYRGNGAVGARGVVCV